MNSNRRSLHCLCGALATLVAAFGLVADGFAQEEKKPNILVIWGDDIGIWNISANSKGMMGYQTPNIDRIAREGVAFTDYYGQQSCTAGRRLKELKTTSVGESFSTIKRTARLRPG